MIKKHAILLGILTALALLVFSTTLYPGGSQHDENAAGFNWRHNYLCNLLNRRAVNGMNNLGMPWAVVGLVSLGFSVALFFYRFSKKIPTKRAANIIRYTGIGSMVFSLLMATPYHDPGVTISGTLMMLSLFYSAVFVLRSKLHWFKLLSVICVFMIYINSFVYYTQTGLVYLPVLQKIGIVLTIGWLLCLEYFTTPKDFEMPPRIANGRDTLV